MPRTRKGRYANKPKRPRKTHVKKSLRERMVEDLREGRGFAGWKVTKDNRVELDYDAFKDHFGSKDNFAKFFRNVLSNSTPLTRKVRDVRESMKLMKSTITKEAQAFQNYVSSHELRHEPSMRFAHRPAFFNQMRPQVIEALRTEVDNPYVAKWNMKFRFEFKKWNSDDTRSFIIHPPAVISNSKESALRGYDKIQLDLEEALENAEREGSGWYPVRIQNVYLNIKDHSPFSGKSYFEITGYTNKMCGLVNVKNDDNCCFLWSLIAAKHPASKGNQNKTCSYRKHFKQYWGMLSKEQKEAFDDGGMDDQTYSEYEKIFKVSLTVLQMVLGKDPFPIYRSIHNYAEKVTLLKAVKVEEDGTEKAHFVWVKNVEHFLYRSFPAHPKTPMSVCMNCLIRHPRDEEHVCFEAYRTKVRCPPKTKDGDLPTFEFKGRRKSQPVSMMVVADFEAYNKTIRIKKGQHSTKISTQEACSYAFLPIMSRVKLGEEEDCNASMFHTPEDGFHLYCGKDAATNFLEALTEYCDKNYHAYIRNPIRMKDLTAKEQEWYDKDECSCVICKKAGEWEPKVQRKVKGKVYWCNQDKTKVRHHNHFNGKYIGPAHNKCNLKESVFPCVTVIFHNLKGYDSHYLLKNLRPHHGEPKPIADNSEKIKALTIYRPAPTFTGQKYTDTRYGIRFVDSFAFLSSSLDTLVKNSIDFDEEPTNQGHGLRHNLPRTSAFLEGVIPRDGIEKTLAKKLCLRKGVYPYEKINDHDKFKQPLWDEEDGSFWLKPSDFYSHLQEGHQELVYKSKHAEAVSRMMGFHTMREYHDFYLTLDVMLLADVFQNFRMTCLNAPNCGQDPCHYFGNPSLVLDSFLKHKSHNVELLTSPTLYNKYRRDGMRGGISYWRRYFTKANNPMHPQYDPSQPMSWIQDMDATSLYPWAGRQRLPLNKFQHTEGCYEGNAMWELIMAPRPPECGTYYWVDIYLPETVEEWSAQVPAYYQRYKHFMVDLFGGDLHDYQANYPILVENKEVPSGWLHPRQMDLYEKMGGHHPTEKLINDLHPKKQYMIYDLTLRHALERGWVVTKVYERMEYKQDFVCRDFMDGCVDLRSKAKNLQEKTHQKTNMNSLIGKFIENVMMHSDFRLMTKKKQLRVNEASGRLKDNWYILNEDLVMGEMIKKTVELNKPIMMGIAVYDISKLLMSHLWYFLQDYYGKKIQLCGTDTDSLIFYVETDDWDSDSVKLNQRSVFEEDHPFYRNSRFSEETTKKLLSKGINPYVGIFDTGEKYLKSVPGFFKPDHDRIIEAAAMRAKMYSFLRDAKVKGENGGWVDEEAWICTEAGKWELVKLKDVQADAVKIFSPEFTSIRKHRDICKAKGLPSSFVGEHYTHAYYRQAVLDPSNHLEERATFSSFKSEQQEIFQIQQTKASIRPVDDKRWSDDGICSLPHGHHRCHQAPAEA